MTNSRHEPFMHKPFLNYLKSKKRPFYNSLNNLEVIWDVNLAQIQKALSELGLSVTKVDALTATETEVVAKYLKIEPTLTQRLTRKIIEKEKQQLTEQIISNRSQHVVSDWFQSFTIIDTCIWMNEQCSGPLGIVCEILRSNKPKRVHVH